MTKSTVPDLAKLPAWLVPLSVAALMIGLVHSPFFARQPKYLSLGITVDLVLVAPLLYWLVIRRRSTPNVITVVFFVAGIFVASMIIPKAYQAPLTLVKTWVLPVVELSILAVILTRLRRIYSRYCRESAANSDFYTALQHAVATTLPRTVGLVFTAEIAALYYGFLKGRKHKLRPHEFSYHRTSGSTVVVVTIMFLVIAETAIVHVLVMHWSLTGAWILTAVSAYTVVQLVGLTRAMRHRLIVIDDQHLVLRYGFLKETVIPVSSIDLAIMVRTSADTEDGKALTFSPLGPLEPPNVRVRLSKPAVLQAMYGIQKTFTVASFYVDEPQRLVSSINYFVKHANQKRSDSE